MGLQIEAQIVKQVWYTYTTEYYPAIKEGNSAICESLDRRGE